MKTIKSVRKNNLFMVKKTVEIGEEHDKWIEENAINFSKWVRQKLDDMVR